MFTFTLVKHYPGKYSLKLINVDFSVLLPEWQYLLNKLNVTFYLIPEMYSDIMQS